MTRHPIKRETIPTAKQPGQQGRYGLNGDKAGQPFIATAIRHDGRCESWPCKTVQSLHPGDRLLIQTLGGGGFGSNP